MDPKRTYAVSYHTQLSSFKILCSAAISLRPNLFGSVITHTKSKTCPDFWSSRMCPTCSPSTLLLTTELSPLLRKRQVFTHGISPCLATPGLPVPSRGHCSSHSRRSIQLKSLIGPLGPRTLLLSKQLRYLNSVAQRISKSLLHPPFCTYCTDLNVSVLSQR